MEHDETPRSGVETETWCKSLLKSRRDCWPPSQLKRQRIVNTTAVKPTITATGISGTIHTFTRYPLNTKFTAVGGVYLILKQNTILYVGQTGDLSSRFDDHHKEALWTLHGADGMAVMGVNIESKRLQIEKDLVDKYKPACNG